MAGRASRAASSSADQAAPLFATFLVVYSNFAVLRQQDSCFKLEKDGCKACTEQALFTHSIALAARTQQQVYWQGATNDAFNISWASTCNNLPGPRQGYRCECLNAIPGKK